MGVAPIRPHPDHVEARGSQGPKEAGVGHVMETRAVVKSIDESCRAEELPTNSKNAMRFEGSCEWGNEVLVHCHRCTKIDGFCRDR